MKRATITAGIAACAFALVVGACGSSSKSTSAGSATTSGGAPAASSSPTTVKIMVGGLDKQIYLPFRLAEQLSFSKQQGLNLQLLDEPAGVDATTNLRVTGCVQFGHLLAGAS